jgi:hypothetical protein
MIQDPLRWARYERVVDLPISAPGVDIRNR